MLKRERECVCVGEREKGECGRKMDRVEEGKVCVKGGKDRVKEGNYRWK